MTRKLDNYSRRQRQRKSTILIGLEGKNKTERNYFEHYNIADAPYKIMFTNNEFTDPVGIINKLIVYANQNEIKTDEDNNKIYCIFDTDTSKEKNKQINEAMKIAKKNNIEIILSNPCFEDWLLCHFQYSTKELSNKEIINELNNYIKPIFKKKYYKSLDIYEAIKDKTDFAIKNSKEQINYHKKLKRNLFSIEANPSAMVYIIVEDLIKRNKK